MSLSYPEVLLGCSPTVPACVPVIETATPETLDSHRVSFMIARASAQTYCGIYFQSRSSYSQCCFASFSPDRPPLVRGFSTVFPLVCMDKDVSIRLPSTSASIIRCFETLKGSTIDSPDFSVVYLRIDSTLFSLSPDAIMTANTPAVAYPSLWQRSTIW